MSTSTVKLEALAIELVKATNEFNRRVISQAQFQNRCREIQAEAKALNSSPNEVSNLAMQNEERYRKIIKDKEQKFYPGNNAA